MLGLLSKNGYLWSEIPNERSRATSKWKEPEYLLVTGAAVTTGASSNTRPAACLAYVMDVHEGIFAAYGVPWNRSVENSGSPQSGALIPVGGGQIRAPIAAKK